MCDHPLNHKKGVIYGLTDKIINLSHPTFQEKNFTDSIKLLLDNGYPLDFIFSNIHNRLKKLFQQKVHNTMTTSHNSDEIHEKYFTVPYIKHISNSFKSVSKKFCCPMAFTIPNTLNIFIKTGKDKIDRSNRCNVVYRIDCRDCDASYVGQTKRRLTTRIKEHKNDINKKSGTLSVISSHRLRNHEFDWEGVQVLDSEPSWYKRIISEMIHIKMQSFGLNKQSDTDMLSDSYFPIIQQLIDY